MPDDGPGLDGSMTTTAPRPSTFLLPTPLAPTGGVRAALRERRSEHGFQDAAVSAQQLSLILSESAGITDAFGRGTPSPARTYPLDVVVVVMNVGGIAPGFYRFHAEECALTWIDVDAEPRTWMQKFLHRPDLASTEAFHVLLFGDEDKLTERFGAASTRLMLLEAGHLIQSMILMATALGIGSCAIGNLDLAADVDTLLAISELEPVHGAAFGHPLPRH